jgi:hypothetical protein
MLVNDVLSLSQKNSNGEAKTIILVKLQYLSVPLVRNTPVERVTKYLEDWTHY